MKTKVGHLTQTSRNAAHDMLAINMHTFVNFSALYVTTSSNIMNFLSFLPLIVVLDVYF